MSLLLELAQLNSLGSFVHFCTGIVTKHVVVYALQALLWCFCPGGQTIDHLAKAFWIQTIVEMVACKRNQNVCFRTAGHCTSFSG